jgi:hypothetical protein
MDNAHQMMDFAMDESEAALERRQSLSRHHAGKYTPCWGNWARHFFR